MELERLENFKSVALHRLSKAEDKLDIAKICLDKGIYDDVFTNCYYCVFNLCVALINANGYEEPSTHKSVLAYFNQEFIHNRNMFQGENLGKQLGQLILLRHGADYDRNFRSTEDLANIQLIKTENIFISVSEEIKKELYRYYD